MGSGSAETGLSGRKVYPTVGLQPDATGYGGEDYSSPYHLQAAQKEHASKSINFVILSFILRIASAVLSLVALSFIVLAKDEHQYATASGFAFRGKALRSRANKFLLAMAAVSVFYEVAQVVFGCVERSTKSADWISGHVATLVTFVADQVLAYLMFAAGAAAGNDVASWRRGDGSLRATETICHGEWWSGWCGKVEVGVAFSYLAFTALAVLAVLSGFKFSTQLGSTDRDN